MRPRDLALSLTIVGFTACTAVHGGDAPRWARAARHGLPERGYDVDHYRIELTLLPETRSIEGRCTIRLVALEDLSNVLLDLAGLEVLEVRDGEGRALAFERARDALTIALAEEAPEGTLLTLDVRYGGVPRTGLWFSGERRDGSGPTQVFSQGQAEHNRGWFPCFDHPSDRATSEILLTMPADWIAVAPGQRIDAVTDGDLRREHWRMTTPHPAYLISIVAGELIRVDEQWRGLPLSYYCEPKYRDWLADSFEETGAILGFLEEYTGVRYPFSKYSQAVVANFPQGGMENISATTLTPLTLGDELSRRDRSSVGLIAHEAAHQWFGDLITCNDWSHVWLNEGFATYMTLLYFEATRGADEFQCLLRENTRRYLVEDRGGRRRPTVWEVWKDPEDLLDTRAYEGAAARLHLLRFLVGDAKFRDAVGAYLARHAGRNVTTEDLQETFESVAGFDLDTFFEEWIYGRGFPEMDFEWSWSEGLIEGTVRQTHDFSGGTVRVFHLPSEIELGFPDRSERFSVELGQRVTTFTFPADVRPEYVRFDPDCFIPKVMSWPSRSAEEWVAIARLSKNPDARRDAALALGPLAGSQKRGEPAREELTGELLALLREDENSWVRADAATALAWVLEGPVWEALTDAATGDAAARVRAAALRSLAYCGPHEGMAALGRRVFDEAFSWETMGAAAALVTSTDPTGAPAWLIRNLQLDSPHDRLAALLLAQLARLEGPAIEKELEAWARDTALSPTARAVAVRELARDPLDRESVVALLRELLAEENFRLRGAVIDGLGEQDVIASRRALTEYYPRARTAKERRMIEAALRPSP